MKGVNTKYYFSDAIRYTKGNERPDHKHFLFLPETSHTKQKRLAH